jgi:hypothetical protein
MSDKFDEITAAVFGFSEEDSSYLSQHKQTISYTSINPLELYILTEDSEVGKHRRKSSCNMTASAIEEFPKEMMH